MTLEIKQKECTVLNRQNYIRRNHAVSAYCTEHLLRFRKFMQSIFLHTFIKMCVPKHQRKKLCSQYGKISEFRKTPYIFLNFLLHVHEIFLKNFCFF